MEVLLFRPLLCHDGWDGPQKKNENDFHGRKKAKMAQNSKYFAKNT